MPRIRKWNTACLECTEPAVCLGLCDMHYRRLHRHGDTRNPGPSNCGVCGKPLNRRSYRGQKPKYHPECRKAAQAISNRAHLLAKHGLTIEGYEKLLSDQNGVCALCCQPETVIKGSGVQMLSVDHDHNCCPGKYSCGKCIRGLLCNDCNRGLGCFKDNRTTLARLLPYMGI